MHTIEICLGSSCYARGAAAYPALVQQWLTAQGLTADVRGHRCGTACVSGPNVLIDGVEHPARDAAALKALLEKTFA